MGPLGNNSKSYDHQLEELEIDLALEEIEEVLEVLRVVERVAIEFPVEEY